MVDTPMSLQAINARLEFQNMVRSKQQLETKVQELTVLVEELKTLKPGRTVYAQALPGDVLLKSEKTAMLDSKQEELEKAREELTNLRKELALASELINKQQRQ
ncbi:hypothetical protein CAOG_04800 [Capsaspora owczarzaki ATCC 30864]|uniref:Prefoldin subunit beta n=1 Tax=Capsaspora owczarzaki (strain ATCC 30864) TaxID=595528 RepID=A0A0D2UGD9_CAPO3|nr:hypothetical protein CAOG_04800 [Capsaspora owczarzaki ATCC 30864]KJE94111.1 hypothetical protein CAOG_004800 [Capsaspora owczarzaki ATCC 30864]|eukprot:XP_004347551.1 hypothetical protein CAOG_04800 [Capsaspora owczarzaki ATCC 30864]